MTAAKPFGVRIRLQIELCDANGSDLDKAGKLLDVHGTRLAMVEPGGLLSGIEADESRVAQHAHRAAREAYAELLTRVKAADRGY